MEKKDNFSEIIAEKKRKRIISKLKDLIMEDYQKRELFIKTKRQI